MCFKLEINSGTLDTVIYLKGRQGMYPNNSKFSIGKLNFDLSYGPKFFKHTI